ncbi:MAG: hypothetical protein JXR83_10645 [Deltaproteobacteria bacterium]|nr:hypothetical protein [Deltaproteobacteria bacterium]
MVATGSTSPHPVLEGGVLRFASAEAFLDVFRRSFNRGAIAVRSIAPLTPLQPFAMEIEVPGIDDRVIAQVQMVGQRGELSLLSVVSAEDHVRDQLQVLADSLETRLKAATAPSPSPAIAAPERAAPVPEPILLQDTAVPVTPPAEMPPAPAQPPAPVQPTAPAQPPAPTPTLVNDTIAFANVAAIDAVQDELQKTGGFMVDAVGGAPGFGSLNVRIALSGGAPGEELTAQVVFAQGNRAALIFSQPFQVIEQLKRMREPPTATGVAGSASTAGALRPAGVSSGVTLPPRPMQNPDSPPAILQLNLAAPPDPRPATKSTLIEVLYTLGKLRAIGTFKVECGQEKIEIPFRSGAMMISDEDKEALLRVVLIPRGTISMAPVLPDRIKSDKHPRDPRGIVNELLRRTLREPRTQDLEVSLGPLWSRYPVPVPQKSPALYGLKLEPKEARFLDVVLDGTRDLSEMMRVAGMLRPSTVRLVYIFIIYQLIEFLDDARYNSNQDPRVQFEAECERLLEANVFDVLGMHWSEHPNVLREKLQKRRDRFGPSSPLVKHAPELAHKVMNAVEKAHNMIADREGRKQARAALGQIDYKSASSILARHAELASLRGEFKLVREALEMAMELYPAKEYQTMMSELLARKS